MTEQSPASFTLARKTPDDSNAMTFNPRMMVFARLKDDVALNNYGLPEYLYSPAYITEDFFELDLDSQTNILNSAVIQINYSEGFPAFENTAPIWSQMPDEPEDIHEIFVEYLQQTESMPIRQIIALKQNRYSTRDIKQAHLYYSWSARARAFDLFNVAAHHKMREKRILSTNDKYFLESERLMKGLMSYFEIPGDEDPKNKRWIEELRPETALRFFETLNKVQRLSLGLSPQGGDNSVKEQPMNADVQTLLKSLFQNSQNPEIEEIIEESQSLEALLQDPDTAAAAQKLLIASGRNKERSAD